MLKVKWGPQVTSCDRRWNCATRPNLFHSRCNSLPLGSLCFQFWLHHSFSLVLDLGIHLLKHTPILSRTQTHTTTRNYTLWWTAPSSGDSSNSFFFCMIEISFLIRMILFFSLQLYQGQSHCCRRKEQIQVYVTLKLFHFIVLVNALCRSGRKKTQPINMLFWCVKY